MTVIEYFLSLSDGRRAEIPSEKDICIAEKNLDISFSKEYKDILRAFGTAHVSGHYIKGLGKAVPHNVVEITNLARSIGNIPQDMYVFEYLGAGDTLMLQRSDGKVYIHTNSGTTFIADSILDYLQKSSIRYIVHQAGEILLNGNAKDGDVRVKTSSRDLVTDCDVKIQDYLVSEIKKHCPDAQFICEEASRAADLSAENLFVIDPLDGTANFVHSMRHSAVSVAWYKNGEPFCGFVFDPYLNEFFEAEKGRGAFLNTRKIQVSDLPLSKSIVSFGTSPYNDELADQTFEKLKSIYGRCQDIRRQGSAALDICYVAAGRTGLYFETMLSVWDYTAAKLILEEAGGYAVDFSGKNIPFSASKSSFIAGNKFTISESGLLS